METDAKHARQLHIGLALAGTWLGGEGWRRGDSRVEDLHDAALYLDLARRAEDAKLDFVFRPDALFLRAQALAGGPGFSSLDPMLLLAALARDTRRIGLVSTASTTFGAPYSVARQLQTLHWLSGGRAGWNIVTSFDGAANFGDAPMPDSEQRYARAQEFTDVVRALWRSYPHAALLADRAGGRYADPHQVLPIAHRGAQFQVAGPLNVPMHGAGEPPLFQAGASGPGRDFAARTADAVFAATPDLHAGIALRGDLRARAQAHGRAPDAVRVLPGLSLFLAGSRTQAQALYRDTHAGRGRRSRLEYLRSVLGVDLGGLAPDQPVGPELLPPIDAQVGSRTHAELLHALIARERPRLDALLERPEVLGSAHWVVIGTPDDAVREIVARIRAGAADGFIALPGGALQSLSLLLEEVVPRLAEQGLFRRDYRGDTLRAHLGMEADGTADPAGVRGG
ncbi:NtaA/DmoA family FMN-dependent monooxygenase [Xanthomonas campestris pv. phormiicola]|nr:NtaA/DmoA family FMN-dependent monooxygenase [Xanthomonas campestris pv. phormiicola]UYC14620.1 NtaA/DmoA family FMN-dependent monooxygenase [Xanthomonas campestris pv. phormiicola]